MAGAGNYAKAKTEPETTLDADMTKSDVVAELRRLRFHPNGFRTIQLDKEVRNLIVEALRQRTR